MFSRIEHLHLTAKNNGVSKTRAYNTDNTLASISFAVASIGNLTYGWDANKNKTSEAIAGTMSNYGFTVPTNGYDSEDRLVGFNRTSGLTLSWSLSAVGDWNSVTTNGTAETRTHGPTHELLCAGGSNVSTDTKGNITLIPSSLRPNASSLLLNWDFDNRLNTADVGNNSSIDLTYKFDAMGRRVFRDDGTTATIYVQAGQQSIADYTAGTAASSPTYRYVYASYIDEPVLRYKPSASESLYYHRNQQYSVVAVTNASAAIVERYAYSAYGVPTITNASGTVLPVGSVDNRYMYTGREWDSLIAQYHYRARMYDANLGRFASRDPMRYFDGLNTYSMAHATPLNSTDSSGMISYSIGDLRSCGRKLWKIVQYGSWVTPCAADLLRDFLDGGRRHGSGNCPKSCEKSIAADINFPPPACAMQNIWATNFLGCGLSSRSTFTLSGHHDFTKTFSYSNYYGFHGADWTSTFVCDTSCEPKGAAGSCCCNCNSVCKLNLNVTDTYDFCKRDGSLPDPVNTWTDKFTIANCACALQTLAYSPLYPNAFKPYPVSCNVNSTKRYDFKHCAGNTLPSTKANCGHTN